MTTAIFEPDGQLALQEANHRFLNTLAALGGFLRRDFGAFVDPAISDAVSVFSGRIQAFACVHRTLGEDHDEALVDAPAYLAKLCAELCAAHLAPRGLYCEFRSDPGVLSREACQTLGLIVVELLTNAAEHSFVGRRSGRICVSLRRAEAAWICQVADNGSGLRGTGKGDGMKLVRKLARAMGGDLRVHSDASGLIVTLRLWDPPFSPGVMVHAATAQHHA
jgi:two-component sensor histidine kinase